MTEHAPGPKFDAVALLRELSEGEVAFIVEAVDTNLLAYQLNDDPMVVSLIERGFMKSELEADPDSAILSLSEKGKAVAQLIMDERKDPPT